MNTVLVIAVFFLVFDQPEWGFFAHRKINELAVYTLPVDMKVFFTPNQDYFARHAIDADKRRYASNFEAPRHYMDLDVYGPPPFLNLSRSFNADLKANCVFSMYDKTSETYLPLDDSMKLKKSFSIWFDTLAMDYYYEDEWLVPLDFSFGLDSSRYFMKIEDNFTKHGVLPYNIVRVYKKLVSAFTLLDASAICRHASDLGHYIGDATVPLHTSSNYNGQKTDQYGIHAFWESRLPECFAEDYDEWVGAADYIHDINDFIWEILLESHSQVDSLLIKEKLVRTYLDDELEYAVIERNGRLVSTQSDTLSTLYHQALGGMVENRYRKAIHSLGSCWYSAWVDAGMPDLSKLTSDFKIEDIKKKGRFITSRKHNE
jgi:hypothetical protein